ncbi:hypothetical protein VTN77DRAFT_837 [Rasamsonia byssochlamydoides]|uniref:uncharacterized protein n=1 Tax=Rasamsonia byssochlamydoides TaxID=89139 RepID=UPI0037448DB7
MPEKVAPRLPQRRTKRNRDLATDNLRGRRDDHMAVTADAWIDLWTEIWELHQQYSLHQQALSQLLARKPKGPWIQEWEVMQRRNHKGKPLRWHQEKDLCAKRGGCCGRECRCCEKALGSYASYPQPDATPVIVYIYGHCTVNCGCCVRFRGFHKPDPDLVNETKVVGRTDREK